MPSFFLSFAASSPGKLFPIFARPDTSLDWSQYTEYVCFSWNNARSGIHFYGVRRIGSAYKTPSLCVIIGLKKVCSLDF